MEHKEMIALLKSQMHMTYAERNEIAVHMNALSERLHQQEAEIEKLVQERGTMRASSPTMEWISVDDRLPEEKQELFMCLKDGEKFLVLRGFYENSEWCIYTGVTFYTRCDDIPSFWAPAEIIEPPKPKEPTFKDVFLEKFPKAKLFDGGTPAVCAKGVFPQIGDYDECCNAVCHECWNQPYFGPKEEGEADA